MKKQKTKSANKTVYIDHWFSYYGEPHNDGVIATQLPNGKWVCELKLPLINQTVKSVANTAANAMENASSKAIPLVDEYLSEHPEITFIHKSLIHHYEFYTDENSQTGFRRNPEYRRKTGEQLLKTQLDCSKAVEKAVSRIKRINGSTKDLFIHVIDKSCFEDDDTIEDIQRKIRYKFLGETSDRFISWISTTISEGCVIAIGKIMED